MVAAKTAVLEVADGSVEPGPGGIHDHAGLPVDQFGDGHAVAHRWLEGAPGRAHGPSAAVGMASSATAGPGVRSSPTSTATGSWRCWAVVASTPASTCQVVAPSR